VLLEGREYFTSANIGIALTDPHFDTSSEILRRAQAVLHEARIEGTGMIKFACDESVRNASEDLQMLNDVHNACQRGEFHVEYQPIFDLRSGRIKSLEALLRWNSPEFGLVPPDRFIPLLEQCGAIHEVGDWVFADACRQAKLWNESSTAPIRVAVNVSAVQFESDDFELRLFRILNQWNCRPTWIELEITESTAIKMVAKMKDRLTSIAERGITLAIDDFGAGYSSFGHLAEMPVHHLKLDRALMSKLPNDRKGAAIVKAIQALSESLGLTLTVEGIERRDQQNFCEEAGLNLVQGFLLGMPALAADITRALGEPQAEFDFA
jgi:EAL domain-containing protein (putative c-di-GMP-specific phosphodiesterase class I)